MSESESESKWKKNEWNINIYYMNDEWKLGQLSRWWKTIFSNSSIERFAKRKKTGKKSYRLLPFSLSHHKCNPITLCIFFWRRLCLQSPHGVCYANFLILVCGFMFRGSLRYTVIFFFINNTLQLFLLLSLSLSLLWSFKLVGWQYANKWHGRSRKYSKKQIHHRAPRRQSILRFIRNRIWSMRVYDVNHSR